MYFLAVQNNDNVYYTLVAKDLKKWTSWKSELSTLPNSTFKEFTKSPQKYYISIEDFINHLEEHDCNLKIYVTINNIKMLQEELPELFI